MRNRIPVPDIKIIEKIPSKHKGSNLSRYRRLCVAAGLVTLDEAALPSLPRETRAERIKLYKDLQEYEWGRMSAFAWSVKELLLEERQAGRKQR